uniref:Ras-related protein Rab-21 n=1 Tax=Xenopsylla cheopis TaxID=163159 RepID=A0A6M2DDA3_XENCH
MANGNINQNANYNFKVVLLGEGCVGKTSLVLRYVEDKFNERHLSTLQASFLNKKIKLDDKQINLAIWDTAGQERFHALGPIYYRASNGALLVYDITDEDSFQKVKNWVKELKKMLGSEIVLIIVGNKLDLEHDRNVSIEEAESYAAQVGAKHFQTSAKLNEGIEDLFSTLTREMLNHAALQQEKQASSLARTSSTRRTNVVIVDDEVPQQKSCCGTT